MNIALIGYGKMGQAIEDVATARGHSIVLKISRENANAFSESNLQMADVAIEFTSPEAAYENVVTCLAAGLPVICGTTGWDEQLPRAKEKCLAVNGSFLHAANFSIGVNIFFEINKHLASIMENWPEYQPAIEEVHHTEKKDKPSGTALALARQIMDNIKTKTHWQADPQDPDDTILPIYPKREPDVPGTHTVSYQSPIDVIEIKHTAHSRRGFALGAVLAAEYIRNRNGVFDMSDVLFRDSGSQ